MAHTQLFTDISEINLDNNFVTNLNSQLLNIDSNFKKLLSLPLVKGDKGDSVGVGTLRTYNEVGGQSVLTDLGKKIIQQIYIPYSQVQRDAIDASLENDGTLDALITVLRDIEINGVGSEFDTNTSTFQATSINIENFPQDVRIYYQSHSEEVTQQETITNYTGVSVGYIFHFDGRLSDVADYENELAVNFIDTSCALMIVRADGEIILDTNNQEVLSDNANLSVMRCSIIPTLYFDGTNEVSDRWSNTFCWMINGRRTGITAQGIKGDKGDNVNVYICSGELTGDNDFIAINSVLSPSGVSIDDIPSGSLAFVWFQHNDGIPEGADIWSLTSVVDNNTPVDIIQEGTHRHVALDLAVGVVFLTANNQPHIDYNVNYTAAPYLSLANIFQSCVLYNEMLRLNKYAYVARGLFAPDSDVRYDNIYTTESLISNMPYHLFGSYRNTENEIPDSVSPSFWTNRTPYAYIGVANMNNILTSGNSPQDIDKPYWQIYRDPNIYNINQLGILRSLYKTFVMHDFKIDILNINKSVLNVEDRNDNPFQTILTLGDSRLGNTGQASIQMYTRNDELTDTGYHGPNGYVPNWWGTRNVSNVSIYHGNIRVWSDPWPVSGNSYGQNIDIMNPYIRIMAETERYIDSGRTSISDWQTLAIGGYSIDMFNVPNIHIHGVTNHMPSQPAYSYPYATHRVEPRIDIEGNASVDQSEDSSFLHITNMKSVFNITGIDENPSYDLPFEIKRTSNYIQNEGTQQNPNINQNFHNLGHYRLGLQCTNASVLIQGNANAAGNTILQVNNGSVRFENDMHIGGNAYFRDSVYIGGNTTQFPGVPNFAVYSDNITMNSSGDIIMTSSGDMTMTSSGYMQLEGDYTWIRGAAVVIRSSNDVSITSQSGDIHLTPPNVSNKQVIINNISFETYPSVSNASVIKGLALKYGNDFYNFIIVPATGNPDLYSVLMCKTN